MSLVIGALSRAPRVQRDGPVQTASVIGPILLGIAPLVVAGCGTSSSTGSASSKSSSTSASSVGQSTSSQRTADSTSTEGSSRGSSSGQGSGGGTCGAVGQACCVIAGGVVGVDCNVGVHCCTPQMICAQDCTTGGDAGVGPEPACGSMGDAGHAVSGACPSGQHCCDDGHTGDPFVFDCIDADAACVPKP
jgi:hypothetical protein